MHHDAHADKISATADPAPSFLYTLQTVADGLDSRRGSLRGNGFREGAPRTRSSVQSCGHPPKRAHVYRPLSPATLEEEREAIGTVSAGVAADRGLAEILFSDVSAAVKESKTRGRNKTIVYRPGQESEIRSDYVRPSDHQEASDM